MDEQDPRAGAQELRFWNSERQVWQRWDGKHWQDEQDGEAGPPPVPERPLLPDRIVRGATVQWAPLGSTDWEPPVWIDETVRFYVGSTDSDELRWYGSGEGDAGAPAGPAALPRCQHCGEPVPWRERTFRPRTEAGHDVEAAGLPGQRVEVPGAGAAGSTRVVAAVEGEAEHHRCRVRADREALRLALEEAALIGRQTVEVFVPVLVELAGAVVPVAAAHARRVVELARVAARSEVGELRRRVRRATADEAAAAGVDRFHAAVADATERVVGAVVAPAIDVGWRLVRGVERARLGVFERFGPAAHGDVDTPLRLVPVDERRA